jgi:hypothetical protein
MSKARIHWYNFVTFIGLTFILTFAFLCGPEIGIFVGLLAYGWYRARERGLLNLQAQVGEGIGAELAEANRELVTATNNLLQVYQDDLVREYKACRTCGCGHSKYQIDDIRLCHNSEWTFPHSPTDPPPNPNPWQHWWCQVHGYLLPPPGFPEDQVFVPSWGCDVELGKRLGKPYWLTHDNHAWDTGYATPPDWYVRSRIEKATQQS